MQYSIYDGAHDPSGCALIKDFSDQTDRHTGAAAGEETVSRIFKATTKVRVPLAVNWNVSIRCSYTYNLMGIKRCACLYITRFPSIHFHDGDTAEYDGNAKELANEFW